MEVDALQVSPERVEADVLAFPVSHPVELPRSAQTLDGTVGRRLRHLIEDGELTGRRGSVALLHTAGELAAHRVAAAGVGASDRVDADDLRTAAARVAARCRRFHGRTVAWTLERNGFSLSLDEQARAIVEGTVLGSYDVGRWKSRRDARDPAVERLLLCGEAAPGVVEVARRAAVVSGWTNRCRDLVNAPPNELTPARLAEQAEELEQHFPALRVEVKDGDAIRSAGMGALAAVAGGSDNPPRLVELRYEPEAALTGLTLGLVGKAITFDSGGISLKPAEHLDAMKGDMAGGGAVLCALGAIAELALPLRVLAVVPACENMPSGRSYRPGDIVRALNGKTIEVTNTDAEGRLILADALTHARRAGATHLLDLATLTGGMVTATGDFYAGLFGNDGGWIDRIRAAAEASGDHAWPMPLHDTYRRLFRSSLADMKNSSEFRQATPVYAARFLQEFVGEGPWAHLDIAGTAYLDRGRGDYYQNAGATGYGVRLVAELAATLSEEAP